MLSQRHPVGLPGVGPWDVASVATPPPGRTGLPWAAVAWKGVTQKIRHIGMCPLPSRPVTCELLLGLLLPRVEASRSVMSAAPGWCLLACRGPCGAPRAPQVEVEGLVGLPRGVLLGGTFCRAPLGCL